MPRSPAAFGAVISDNVVAARGRLRLKQSEVAVRMRALGFSWHPQTVGEVEKGNRRLNAEEILGLALALETSIGALLDPTRDDRFVVLPAGQRIGVMTVLRSIRHFNDGLVHWEDGEPRFDAGEPRNHDYPEPFDFQVSPEMMRARNERVDLPRPVQGPPPRREDSGEQSSQARQPVVAAIVTSDLGVLVGRRNDGKPPWTFIAGEVEPGERPEDAAIREVKEETGLRVTAGQVIGERVHPKTGRTMIYMAAAPTHGTDVFVGDSDELAEVRWVGLAEADELLPGMYEPVRDYLGATIGEGSES